MIRTNKSSIFGTGETNVSSVLLTIGVISLCWSVPMFFIAGGVSRIGSLVFGFFSIGLAALIRSGLSLDRYLVLFFTTGSYFLLLALQSKIQEHQIWHDSRQIIFSLVCLFLFWFGFILGKSKVKTVNVEREWILVFFGMLGMLAVMGFLRFVKKISFYGVERGFGDNSLNPVGVAYYMMCLTLTYLAIGVYTPTLWRKILFFAVSGLALLAALSSASRGALLAGILALIYFSVLNRRRVKWSVKSLLTTVVGILTMLIIGWVSYYENYAISERIELLIERINHMFMAFTGEASDASMSARELIWNYYIQNIEAWIFFGERGYSDYPHNQFLEILVRFGLLGVPLLLMSVFVFIWVLHHLLKSKRQYDLEFSLISILFIFSYLQSMTSLSLQINRVMWLGFGYFLGVFFNKIHRNLSQPYSK
ncbi:MAG: O-antigen ligase [Candidatus Endobugula sp.]|jgi:O-antigen ligase